MCRPSVLGGCSSLVIWPAGAPLITDTTATSSASPEWTRFIGVALERVSALFQEEGFLLLPNGSSGKESACSAGDAGDTGSSPGPGRSPVGGNGNPLHYCCLGNSMDRRAWRAVVHGVAESQT